MQRQVRAGEALNEPVGSLSPHLKMSNQKKKVHYFTSRPSVQDHKAFDSKKNHGSLVNLDLKGIMKREIPQGKEMITILDYGGN